MDGFGFAASQIGDAGDQESEDDGRDEDGRGKDGGGRDAGGAQDEAESTTGTHNKGANDRDLF